MPAMIELHWINCFFSLTKYLLINQLAKHSSYLSLNCFRDLLYKIRKLLTSSAIFSSLGLDTMFFSRRVGGSGTKHCDWFILPLLHPTPTIWFSLDHKRYIRDGVLSGRKWKRSDSSDSAYNSDFWFTLGHKHSYDSAYDSNSDSVANENQP